MNAGWVAVRAGGQRGWIELRHTFTTPSDLVTLVVWTAILLTVMIWMRTTTVPGTHFSLGTAMLASMIGMTVAFNGLATLGGILTVEREDGTLLRAKATPNGMTGYLVGKVITVSGTILIGVATTLITGAFLFSGLAVGSAATWLTLVPVLLLGLLATLPIGAVLGSLFPSARSAGLLTLAIGGLAAISGIFYPITHLPHWLQWIGQVFPMYWLGLGTRSALLPANLASVEIGHSWRHLATFGVLAAWAVAGLLVAPLLLRWVARRESGSSVAARREKVLRRVAG
jgi:ABC-2 type transport system permease protein